MLDKNTLLDMMETPIVIIDRNYKISYCNNAAKELIKCGGNILEVINEEYQPVFTNGVQNRFPFTLSEKRLFKKTILNTTDDSYKLVAKPIENDLMIIEFILIGTIQKRTALLIKKNRDFIRHSSILSELISLKSGGKSIDRIGSDDILKIYEEQLKLQFSIDDAISKTIEPIVSGNLNISDAAGIILKEIKEIIGCRTGVMLAAYGDGFSVIDRFDDDGTLDFIKDFRLLYDFTAAEDRPVFNNEINKTDYPEELWDSISLVNNYIIIPLVMDNVKYGFILLANSDGGFTETHFNIAKRLGQLFSIAFERAEYMMQLEEQASIDQLTGCLNRRAGMARLNSLYIESNHSGQPFSIVFFDVNGLKMVNDTYGHDEGDDLIRSFSNIVKDVTRGNDIFARFGGDEFVLGLPKCPFAMAQKLIQRINDAITRFNRVNNKVFRVSVSAGSVEYASGSDTTVKQLVNKADEIMYENKRKYKQELKEKNENTARG